MENRELLELAAKALGARFRGGESKYIRGTIWGLDGDNFPVEWNPMTDDGDAFRLAVKLGLIIETGLNGCSSASATDVEYKHYQMVDHGVDVCFGVRSAIVRAAAEIGRSIP